jgi:hypothetical protein
MGRWDKFDKNRKIDESKITAGMQKQMDDLLNDLDKLPPGERREVAAKMKELLQDALALCNAPDTKPVDDTDVIATAVLLYAHYNEFNNPSIMIAVITKLAKKHKWNPNTFKAVAAMVAQMCKERFE